VKIGLARGERTTTGRSGAILLLFALLTFVFFAIAGIVIDVGLANLAQSQMQVAVDTAALEGCRWRNFDDNLGESHGEKREKVRSMLRLAFDDDLHPTRGGGDYSPEYGGGVLPADDEDAYRLGAGPSLAVEGGVGAWAANAVVGEVDEGTAARIDDPLLQYNLLNRANGDMVAGKFILDRDADGDGFPDELENGTTYVRDDFIPATSGTEDRNALSFLVRMRRAGDQHAVDNQIGISSSLPTLPLTFGLGSTVLQAPGGDWDPRRDGITVRATAIASARPALRVGRPPCDAEGNRLLDHQPDGPDPISGLLPFHIPLNIWREYFCSDAIWQQIFPPFRVRPDSQGALRLDVGAPPAWPVDTIVGHFMFPWEGTQPGSIPTQAADPCAAENGWPEVIGRPVVDVGPPSSGKFRSFGLTGNKPAYVAITEQVADPNGQLITRVVGYGFVDVGDEFAIGVGGTYPGEGVFSISPGSVTNFYGVRVWIAQDNASAILRSAADTDTSATPLLQPSVLQEVLRLSNVLAYGTDTPDPKRVHDYTYVQRGTVLAPALTR